MHVVHRLITGSIEHFNCRLLIRVELREIAIVRSREYHSCIPAFGPAALRHRARAVLAGYCALLLKHWIFVGVHWSGEDAGFESVCTRAALQPLPQLPAPI
jgi:hypothetical protein